MKRDNNIDDDIKFSKKVFKILKKSRKNISELWEKQKYMKNAVNFT